MRAQAADEPSGTVVVVDDDPDILALTELWLGELGYRVESFEDAQSFLDGMGRLMPETVCLDLNLPGLSGNDALDRLQSRHRDLPVVVITTNTKVDSVVSAMQRGAYDYLVKPLDRNKLGTTVRNAVERHRMAMQLAHLEREVDGGGHGGLVGDSPSMRQLFRQMDRVAASEITVLIHGESGTGKELVARAIHEASGRARGPYVTLNCAAIAESLQESELFGHEKGSFTGAEQRRIGRFEQADGGTLFLDEVAELSPALQAKLLRVLQERRFQRVGGTTEIQSDFRLIAATHRNLGDEVRAGRFREDLFFRIAVLELEIPPLRDRGDDVLLLSRSFLREISQQERGGAPITLAPSARSALLRYDWPGNVRELQNALHRGYVLSGGDTIRARDLPERILAGGYEESPSAELPSVPDRPVGLLRGGPAAPLNGAGMGHGAPSAAAGAGVSSLDEVEREAIRLALERCHWNLSEAGRQLGIGRTTLYRKIKKYGLR